MEIFTDVALLSRIQFALTAMFHFFFVPLSVGLGLILAINETRYYRTRDEKDAAATKFWVKIFTLTFVVGVATGITMEFSFGTNWADYSRFVGDIFGAPLAAEALLAFFLESVFLGVLVFGRKRVSPKFYLVSSWLVWIGSALSALWILIANSWMQTPAGAELAADGSKAVITNFFAAAFNPSLAPRYFHTVISLIVMGAFITMAVAAWYMRKDKHAHFAGKTMRIGSVVAIVMTGALLVSAHASAKVVYDEQPTKLAMMEGMYESGVPSLTAIGFVDEENQRVVTPFEIIGGTSFLATGTWDSEYPGLNDLAKTEEYSDMNVEDMPVNLVFQSYHLMIIMFGLIAITVVLALVFTYRGERIRKMKWLQSLIVISPLFPFIAIQSGWMTAEFGRQPWVVYPSTTGPDGVSLLTNNAISQSLSSTELLITVVLFIAIYAFLFIAWARIMARFIKQGPVVEKEAVAVVESSDSAKASKRAAAGKNASGNEKADSAKRSNTNEASTQDSSTNGSGSHDSKEGE